MGVAHRVLLASRCFGLYDAAQPVNTGKTNRRSHGFCGAIQASACLSAQCVNILCITFKAQA